MEIQAGDVARIEDARVGRLFVRCQDEKRLIIRGLGRDGMTREMQNLARLCCTANTLDGGLCSEEQRVPGIEAGDRSCLLFRAAQNGSRIGEVPIIFIERRQGQSKVSKAVLLESLITPWRLRLRPRG